MDEETTKRLAALDMALSNGYDRDPTEIIRCARLFYVFLTEDSVLLNRKPERKKRRY